MKYTESDIQNILIKIHNWYDENHKHLIEYAKNATNGGQIRNASGNFIENFLQNIFNILNEYFHINIVSKVGNTDLLSKKIHYKGQTLNLDHIQVDRHILNGDKRIAFIENKTYLDSCYWDRALADFRKIVQALNQTGIDPANVEYIVFAGQDSLDTKTKLVYEGDFCNDTKHLTSNPKGIEPKVFYFLKQKRNSQKPMYQIKYDIDDSSVVEFIKLILSLV